VDWPTVRAETANNDYAVAFVLLAERLGLTER
jgi:hypothetical protein